MQVGRSRFQPVLPPVRRPCLPPTEDRSWARPFAQSPELGFGLLLYFRELCCICERFHRTIQEEFYATAFRKKLYHSLEELQADLDLWLDEYNRTRPHSGKYCYGKTPMQTFLDSLPLAREKMLDSFVNAAPVPERSPEQRSAGAGASPATAA